MRQVEQFSQHLTDLGVVGSYALDANENQIVFLVFQRGRKYLGNGEGVTEGGLAAQDMNGLVGALASGASQVILRTFSAI